MDGETGPAPQQALAAITRQRSELARRIRMPGWYLALYAAALLSLFVVPSLITAAGRNPSAALVPAVMLPALVVLGLQAAVISHASGARLPVNTIRAYPSARRAVLVCLAALAGGSAATWVTAVNTPWPGSLACGVACGAAVTAAQLWTLAAIRSDIRTGRAAAR